MDGGASFSVVVEPLYSTTFMKIVCVVAACCAATPPTRRAPDRIRTPPATMLLKYCRLIVFSPHTGWWQTIAWSSLFHKDPCRLQEREGDQANDRRHRDQGRIIDVPAEQHHQTEQRHQHGEPVANGNLPQQHTRPQDRPNSRRVSAFHKPLYVAIGAVADQDRRDDERKEKGWQEDAHRRHEGARESRYNG